MARKGHPYRDQNSRIWKLRDGHSESLASGPEWSYPCSVEHDGMLYVVYTSEKRHCAMTAVPVESLRVEFWQGMGLWSGRESSSTSGDSGIPHQETNDAET